MALFEQKKNGPQSGHLISPANPDRATPQPVHAENPILARQQTLGNQAAQRFAESCPLGLPGPSLCPFGGTCHNCPAPVQAKLKVNEPADRYEQEADRVADAVMRMSEPYTRVQRACSACGEEETLQSRPVAVQITPLIQRQFEPEAEEEEEPQEEEEEEPIQTKGISGQTPGSSPGLAAQVRAARSRGEPLPQSVRDFFEPRFGREFGEVRVHTDNQAAETAHAINARAFTIGRDIVFGANQYQPDAPSGRHLLAHELTHVVQQAYSPPVRTHSTDGYPATSRADVNRERHKPVPSTSDAMAIQRELIGNPERIGRTSVVRIRTRNTRNLSEFVADVRQGVEILVHPSRLDGIMADSDFQGQLSDYYSSWTLVRPGSRRMVVEIVIDRTGGMPRASLSRATNQSTGQIEDISPLAAAATEEPAPVIESRIHELEAGERPSEEERRIPLLIRRSEVGVYEFLLETRDRFSRFHGVETGRINGNSLEFGERQIPLISTPELEEGQTVSLRIGEGVFFLRSVPVEGGPIRTLVPAGAYEIQGVNVRGDLEPTGLRVRTRGLGAISEGILVYSARIRHLAEERVAVRPPVGTAALAEQIVDMVSGAARLTAPGMIATQIVQLLRPARLTSDEMMDILQRLERANELSHFLELISIQWFRQFLRAQGVSWHYIFMNWEPGFNQFAEIFAGFVIGAGQNVYDSLRIIYVLIGANFSRELALEGARFILAIERFFRHPILSAERTIRHLYDTFVGHLWNLELFEAGRMLGNAAVIILTLPAAIRALPSLAGTVARLSVRSFRAVTGVSRDVLLRFARGQRPRMELPEGQVLMQSGDDIVVIREDGQTARISRQDVVEELGEGSAGPGARPAEAAARRTAPTERAAAEAPPERGRRAPDDEPLREPPEPGERRRIHEEETRILDIREGFIHRGLDSASARASYEVSLAQRPASEAAIFRNFVTDEYIVVEGGRRFVETDWHLRSEFSGHPRVQWDVVRHYHPSSRVTARLPSWSDFRNLLQRYLRPGVRQQPISSRIDYRDPVTGDMVSTEFGFIPGADMPYWVRFQNPRTRIWEVRPFEDVPWNPGSDFRRFLDDFRRAYAGSGGS